MHPQTLRLYEREGLIRPARSSGNTRLYDIETVERLEIILTLTRELGVNLAGVEVILDLRSRLAQMEGEVGRLMEAVRAVAKDHAARGGAHARDERPSPCGRGEPSFSSTTEGYRGRSRLVIIVGR